ncbi:hypothetical protein HNO88_000285 [Novosphingobium chloroacetimidivorans]|uniref:Uncharacterized protein n=1 Tax=Novosphingobium chloroacetimidivorans TaxID=1428314 RepID=A0A7W7NTX9_9SPHN|nr:hypothetical protein [Novosphingobium chloroacetimidivorans]MBB4856988.1 hypothetical protein [Novosphingobium chloroacetimidivorans]
MHGTGLFDFSPLETRVTTSSARMRADMFRQRLAVASESANIRKVLGEPVSPVLQAYERLLRAQVDFAEAQLKVGEKSPQHDAGSAEHVDPVPHP